MRLLPVLLLVVARVAQGCYEKDDWSIRTPEDFPLVPETEQIELFFLRAELEKAAKWSHNTTFFGALNGYHSGIGFRATNGTTWQVEYDADDFVGAVFPKVQLGKVMWTNEAEVCATPYIRDTYWSRATTLATVSGTAYNKLAQTIGRYIQNHSSYQAFTPVAPPGNAVLMRADTCTDFTHAVLRKLELMKVPLKPVIPTTSSQFSLHVNASAPLERIQIGSLHPVSTIEVLEFYTRLRAVIDAKTWSGRILDIVLLGLELETKVFYILDTTDPSHESYFKYILNNTRPMTVDLVDLRR
jgi:hypothetical protein